MEYEIGALPVSQDTRFCWRLRFKNRVLSEFGNGKYLQLQEAIDNNTITSAQVEALKDEIEDQVLALLGPFRIL